MNSEKLSMRATVEVVDGRIYEVSDLKFNDPKKSKHLFLDPEIHGSILDSLSNHKSTHISNIDSIGQVERCTLRLELEIDSSGATPNDQAIEIKRKIKNREPFASISRIRQDSAKNPEPVKPIPFTVHLGVMGKAKPLSITVEAINSIEAVKEAKHFVASARRDIKTSDIYPLNVLPATKNGSEYNDRYTESFNGFPNKNSYIAFNHIAKNVSDWSSLRSAGDGENKRLSTTDIQTKIKQSGIAIKPEDGVINWHSVTSHLNHLIHKTPLPNDQEQLKAKQDLLKDQSKSWFEMSESHKQVLKHALPKLDGVSNLGIPFHLAETEYGKNKVAAQFLKDSIINPDAVNQYAVPNPNRYDDIDFKYITIEKIGRTGRAGRPDDGNSEPDNLGM